MKAPIRKLTKDKIIWLSEHHCKHGITYLEHYNCFLKEAPSESPFIEKTACFDIETTGFNADYDFMLSYALLDVDTDDLIIKVIEPAAISQLTFDYDLIKELLSDLRKFNRIIVFNGGDYRFDIPFARTRALRWGLDFPAYRELYINDLCAAARAKFKLASYRLAAVCSLFNIPAKGHPGDPNIWMRAAVGDKEALEYIKLHNIEDVVSLKQLWIKMKDMLLIGRRSL